MQCVNKMLLEHSQPGCCCYTARCMLWSILCGGFWCACTACLSVIPFCFISHGLASQRMNQELVLGNLRQIMDKYGPEARRSRHIIEYSKPSEIFKSRIVERIFESLAAQTARVALHRNYDHDDNLDSEEVFVDTCTTDVTTIGVNILIE